MHKEERMLRSLSLVMLLAIGLFAAIPAAADGLIISTGNPDGLIAMASRPESVGKIEIEAADDFVLTGATNVTSGSFVGLLPTGASLSSISEVVVEIYRVFPNDSTVPPSGNVLTRVNSPSDVAFDSRDSSTGSLTFTPGIVQSSFTAANSVLNGINKFPNQFTGGEGAVTGEEVSFNVTFTTPFDLPADHYFFVPQVLLTDGDFFWLSAPKPIVPPGTPFPAGSTDLQTWIRNGDLDPDWSRVGTDITHQGPFNGVFSLSGSPAVPEPSSLLLLGTGLLALVGFTLKKTSA
jgi:PEP-CTERM motif